jgi:cell pole-organizing protein PopZ
MSSFDKTAGKNLDEILASIRKTLADESPHPEAKAKEINSLAEPKATASVNHNGSKSAANKIDEDLADLLAGGLATPAPTPKDTPGAADQKDPLWFLRPSGGRESQVLPLPADRVSPSFEALADGPANPAPERSSPAPLFVADNGSGDGQASLAATGLTSAPAQGNAAPAAASAPIESKPAAEASPRDAAAPANAAKEVAGSSPLPEVAGLSAAVKAPTPAPTAATLAPKADLAKPGLTASAPAAIGPGAAALKPPAASQPQATTTAPIPVRPAEPGKPAAAPAAAPLRAALGISVGSPTKSASVSPRATVGNGAASTAMPPAAASPPNAASATTVPTTQTQALEQIIEQLLEPLLSRWVEANLPRLVDAAIRAEVARALHTKQLNGQDADRKV